MSWNVCALTSELSPKASSWNRHHWMKFGRAVLWKNGFSKKWAPIPKRRANSRGWGGHVHEFAIFSSIPMAAVAPEGESTEARRSGKFDHLRRVHRRRHSGGSLGLCSLID